MYWPKVRVRLMIRIGIGIRIRVGVSVRVLWPGAVGVFGIHIRKAFA